MAPKTARQIAQVLIDCFVYGGKVLICGNGGSAAEAQHLAAELVCGMDKDKEPGFPAIALTTDSSILTAWSNDVGYSTVFSRQVEVLGNMGDVLICLSTSGKSLSCILASRSAIKKGLRVVDFPRTGKNTAQIQENQLKLIHKVCRLVESGMKKYEDS